MKFIYCIKYYNDGITADASKPLRKGYEKNHSLHSLEFWDHQPINYLAQPKTEHKLILWHFYREIFCKFKPVICYHSQQMMILADDCQLKQLRVHFDQELYRICNKIDQTSEKSFHNLVHSLNPQKKINLFLNLLPFDLLMHQPSWHTTSRGRPLKIP